MANSDAFAGLQRQDVDRSPAFSAAMFGRKPERIAHSDSPIIIVGEDTGCRR